MDPFIQVMFKQNPNAGDEPVSLVIFEYNDKELLGYAPEAHPDEVGTLLKLAEIWQDGRLM